MTKILLHHIYGRSYFGSGGGHGGVFCSPNCRAIGSQDNGFMSGPAEVEVIDPTKPARFYARGGDYIGEGRYWSQVCEFVPNIGWVHVPNPPPMLPGDNREEDDTHRQARRTWLVS